MNDNPDLTRLAAYRLERDLTYDELAAQMKTAGYPVRARSLHLALTARLQTQPRERTLYKIAQFVATLKPRKPRAKTARRPRRTGAPANV
jgi:hypothetical protein